MDCRLKIIEASISENGKEVFILVEWKVKGFDSVRKGGDIFRTSRTLKAEDVFMIEVEN